MSTNWRISSFNGALVAAYFIPTWTLVALRIIASPIQGLFERPNVAAAFFISDHLQLGATDTLRAAWLLALGRLAVVAFFAIFLALVGVRRLRRSDACVGALWLALGIGSLISFALMVMASQVGEVEALRLHATELMMLLGAATVLVLEPPAGTEPTRDATLEQPQLAGDPSQ
ncbi:MAG: hypothetical protein ACREDL_17490 [Bradyrhizobium sp.]